MGILRYGNHDCSLRNHVRGSAQGISEPLCIFVACEGLHHRRFGVSEHLLGVPNVVRGAAPHSYNIGIIEGCVT